MDELSGFEVATAQDMGWGDLDDGPLLDAMAGRFDALVTVDKGLPAQQVIEGRAFAIVLLRAPTNRLEDLCPLAAQLRDVLRHAEPAHVYVVRLAGSEENGR